MRARRIDAESEKHAFVVDSPLDLIPYLKLCAGQQLIGFDEKGLIRAEMRWSCRPFLTTVGPRGGNRRVYKWPGDVDFLTEVWLITLRWVMCGGVEHHPPLVQLAFEGQQERLTQGRAGLT